MKITVAFCLLLSCSLYSVIYGVNIGLQLQYNFQDISNRLFNQEFHLKQEHAEELFLQEEKNRKALIEKFSRQKENERSNFLKAGKNAFKFISNVPLALFQVTRMKTSYLASKDVQEKLDKGNS